jgi:hypothetical protein
MGKFYWVVSLHPLTKHKNLSGLFLVSRNGDGEKTRNQDNGINYWKIRFKGCGFVKTVSKWAW